MNLKAKTYVQDHKLAAEQKLAARQAILNEKGMDEKTIGKDVMIRKFKADLRKARLRLQSVAAQEKLLADRVQDKADKLAAKKLAAENPKAGAEKKVEAKAPKKEKKPKEKKAAAPKA